MGDIKYTEDQLKIINHYLGNAVVYASAGSGKSSVLTERVKTLVNKYNVKQENILCNTFSKKATENMRNKLGEEYSGVTVTTFHALGYRMLREQNYFPKFFQPISPWEIKKIIEDISVELSLVEDRNNVELQNILSYINTQKSYLIRHTDKQRFVKNSAYSFDTMCQIYKKYEYYKHKKKKIDFNDMILHMYYLLKNNHKARQQYASKFKFVMVDECQDTSHAQYEILRLLCKTNNNLFVVGDALQSIYSFRNCDNNYFLHFHEDWVDTHVFNLGLNFRSTDNIVKLSNKLVEGTIETTHENYIESKSHADKFKNPKYTVYDDDTIESIKIAKKIKRMVKTGEYTYGDFSVIVRTNFQLQSIENSLFDEKIDYQGVGIKSFYDRKEIKILLDYLRFIEDNEDNESFENIANKPNRYLGKVFIDEVSTYSRLKNISMFESMLKFPRKDEWRYKKGISELVKISKLLQNRKFHNVADIIELVRKTLEFDKYIKKEVDDENDDRMENIDKFQTYCSSFTNINQLLNKIDNMQKDSKEGDDKVNLMTIHKSKGLEFKVVFIPSVNNGILPHHRSDNIDEERRLLYVAMTRAEKELFISSARRCGKTNSPSEFLYSIFNDVDKKFDGEIDLDDDGNDKKKVKL